MLNVEKMDPARFENHVCHLFPRTQLAEDIEASGASLHFVSANGRLGVLKRIRHVARLIRSLEIDLVHTSNVGGEMVGGFAARWCGVPAVVTLTNTAYEPFWLIDNPNLNRFKLGAVKHFRRFYLPKTHDHFVAISEFVRKSAIDGFKLPEERISVIYRGVEEDFPQLDDATMKKARESLGLAGRSPVLLNVGRLVPQKGQKYLIEAMPEVLRRHPSALLLIAGTGFLKETLESAVERLGLGDSVCFLGSREDVPELMALSDIFVFPSLFEGFGVSLLEASAIGKASIATRVGPIPEVVEDGETGLLVPPQDPAELAAAILRLADAAEMRQRLGKQARERVHRKFSISDTARRFEEVYFQLLENGSGH